MPSNAILERKKQVVSALAEELKNSPAGVVVKYEGYENCRPYEGDDGDEYYPGLALRPDDLVIWKKGINSFNGTQYGTTDYVFPAKNGDDMTYVTHTLTAASPISGSFTFSLGKKQCCLILTLYQNNGNTAITQPVSNEQQTPIYNLQGVRVTNPGQGIYIQNGKKYIK